MSLFVCDTCNCIANTATDDYWEQSAVQAQAGIVRSQRTFQCSECRKGEWHGVFPKQQWDGVTPMKNRGNSGPALPPLRDPV